MIRRLFRTLLVLSFGVCLFTAPITTSRADVQNCVAATIFLVSPPLPMALGSQLTIGAAVTNTCSGTRTVSFGVDVYSDCTGAYSNLLNVPSLTISKDSEAALYLLPFTPPCAGEWQVNAATLYQRRFTNEAVATFVVE